MFKNIENWSGARKNLIDLISDFEKKDPKKFGMYSKKTGDFLPVNTRRIQQFIDQGILTNPEVGKDGYIYNADHFFRYMGAIELRNSGQPVKQIAKILLSFDTEDIKEKILGIGPDGDHINNNDEENINYLTKDNEIHEKLKKLGRVEGRVLRSQWVRFAVTNWFNVEVKKKELKNLSDDDINVLGKAFVLSLKETVNIAKNDKLDRKIG